MVLMQGGGDREKGGLEDEGALEGAVPLLTQRVGLSLCGGPGGQAGGIGTGVWSSSSARICGEAEQAAGPGSAGFT